MKKSAIAILVITCILISIMPVYGAATISYNDYAIKLSQTGIFRGTGTGFELDREPTRLEGIIMLVRLLGKETAANQLINEKCVFTDVPDWGKGYVNYAYKNGLTSGLNDKQFGSQNKIDGKSYVAFLLRSLGYYDSVNSKDFTWAESIKFAKSIGLLDDELYTKMSANAFIRDYVAKSSYNTLIQPVKGGAATLLQKLVSNGVMTQAQADSIISTTKSIDYVAIGDSVASGVRGGVGIPGSEQGSDCGYTDGIAKKLKDAGALGSFNKQFCVSGMTSKALAQASEAFAFSDTFTSNLIKNSEIITLNIGADDLLIPLYSYIMPLIEDPKSDWYTNQAEVVKHTAVILNEIDYVSKGTEIKANIEKTLQNILNTNKSVKIYVMDYYNPLPVLSAAYGVDLNTPVKYINGIINSAVADVIAKNQGASITCVETMNVMSAAGNLVPTDIHPTVAGYQAITAEFWNKIRLNLAGIL